MSKKVDYVFIDSGTGGLPYMRHLIKKCPNAHCVYVADTLNFPYGEKNHEQIKDVAYKALCTILEKYTPNAVIISCNTLSIVAIDYFRKRFPDILFVGTVPAIKSAGKVSVKRRIGLLATNRTVESEYTQNLIKDFARDCEIIFRGDPELISFIENSFFFADEKQKEAVVSPVIDFFRSQNVDTVILGCTHFLHIVDIATKLANPDITIIDSCAGVVNQALRIAPIDNDPNDHSPTQLFFITGHDESIDDESFQKRYQAIAQKMNITYGGIID